MDGYETQRADGQRPVPRRPSRAVYRRRRLVAGLLALLLLIGLAFLTAGLMNAFSGDGAAPAEAGAPAASHSAAAGATPSATAPAAAAPTAAAPTAAPTAPAATPTPTPTATPAACPATSISVAAATDAQSYAAPAAPVLTMTVTNTGKVPCEVNVGTAQMEFSISSGADRIFSSADCQQGAEDFLKEFEPGATEKANFTWERLRSAPGCASVASNPNPGWYVFTARLGGVTSEKAVFQLD